MKILLLVLAGLSAFWLGVIAAVLRQRRRNTEVSPHGAVRRGCDDTVKRLNLEYRNFLNYDGGKQA